MHQSLAWSSVLTQQCHQTISQFCRRGCRLFSEAEEGGDFGGGFGEGESEFAVVHLLVGGHEEIEIEGEIFGGGVEDDADDGAGDFVFTTDVGDDLGFHFDGVGVSRFPELVFFGGG